MLATISGCAIALVIGVLVFSLYVFESRTDAWHEGRIFRVLMTDPFFNRTQPYTYHELPRKLDEYSEIIAATHLYYPGHLWLRMYDSRDTMLFREKGAIFADDRFFDVFAFDLSAGDRQKCLSAPYSVVLSPEKTKQLFGRTDVLGEELIISGKPFHVTGVLVDAPANSHLKLAMLLSYATLPAPDQPLDYGGFTYLKVRPDADPVHLASKLNANKKSLFTFSAAQWPDEPFRLENLSDAYYCDDYEPHLLELFETRSRTVLDVSLLLGILVFLVSFINLLIFFYSRLLIDSKYLVILHVFGGHPIFRFLKYGLELFIVLFSAFLVSLLLAGWMMPVFNELTGSILPSFFFFDPLILVGSISIMLITAVVGGAVFGFATRRVKTRSGAACFP